MSLIRLPQLPVSGARVCSFLDSTIPLICPIILRGRGIFYYLCDISYRPQCDTVDDSNRILKSSTLGMGPDEQIEKRVKKRSKKFRVHKEIF